MKRICALLLTLTLCVGLTLPAGASGAGIRGSGATVSTGDKTTAAIQSDGSLWMWGSNKDGQLGNNGVGNANYTYDGNHPIQTVPLKVLDDVVAVSCGPSHTAAIQSDGSLWIWGWGKDGRLGDGRVELDYHVSAPIKVMDNVAAVSCGDNYTAAIKIDGTLWSWGGNASGQLGTGDVESRRVPTKVMDNVSAVSCGNYTTAVIKTDGSLWMCGSNTYGAIGNGKSGTEANQLLPVKIMDRVSSVSTGGGVTAAIQADGSLWMWGDNRRGTLGNGTQESAQVPVWIMGDVAAVSCGNGVTAVIKTDGSLWMWGSNSTCQLGNGGGGNATHQYAYCQTVPLKVLDQAAAVSVNGHVAAVKTDGTLWMWGDNLTGQVGIGNWGTNNIVPKPTQVMDGVALSSSAVVPSVTPSESTVAGFYDVYKTDYYADAVAWAKASSVTGGTSATTFSPGNAVTRAEAVTFLWRAAGSPVPGTSRSPFADVTDTGAYYYRAVLWASDQGITGGVGNGQFGLSATLTYDQILAMLCRASGGTASGGDWSAAAVSWAAENGLTQGLTFSPKDNCPRSDVVYCLWKQLA